MLKAIKPIQRTYEPVSLNDVQKEITNPILNRYKVGELVCYNSKQYTITNIAKFVARLMPLDRDSKPESVYLKDVCSIRHENLKLV